MMVFADRAEAGRKLGERLRHLKDMHPVVLALVRGGVPVAFEVARALDAPLDIVLVRKIGVPGNAEFAAGAVVDGACPEIVLNTDIVAALDISQDYLRGEAGRQLAEIERRRALYIGARPRAVVEGRTAIVVDDGVATGATTRAALHALRRQKPARLVLAVPVAPPETVGALRDDADEIVCLTTPSEFGAIGFFYLDFGQVEDSEVIRLLSLARSPSTARNPSEAARG